MAVLICDMKDCKHRSKHPLRSWETQSGSKCYGCARKFAVVTMVFDPDGDIEATAGKENMAICAFYEPEEKNTPSDEQDGDSDGTA